MSTHRGFEFYSNCVDCPGDDPGRYIQDMRDEATDITRGTFLRYVGRDALWEVEQRLGYFRYPQQGLTMSGDWHVSYHKGKFRSVSCVFFIYSATEYIFIKFKTTARVSYKKYKCSHCGHESSQQTNHWGATYGRCDGCSWKRPLEANHHTCMEEMPFGYKTPPEWQTVKLGDIAEIIPGGVK
jgi:DNA-directed RNA polymerase subunit RPC12/RpoP